MENKATLFSPKKFILFLLLASVVMMFAAFTSAYIVRKGEGNWLEFDLPSMFQWSTVVIVLSSITLLGAQKFNREGKNTTALQLLIATLILGIIFLFLQYGSWSEIYHYKYPVVFGGKYSNPSGSFLYVISGLHGAHIIGGIIYLAAACFSVKKRIQDGSKSERLELCAIFWHFLGGLWLYLYIFLIVNH